MYPAAREARRLGVFHSRAVERRYPDLARFVVTALPANAAFFTVQHSGSLRFYARRLTIRFDSIDPDWLDRSIEHLRRLGYRPIILLEDWEVEAFKQRFSATNAAGRLEWCPLAVMSHPVTVFLYDTIERSCEPGTQRIPMLGDRCCGPLD